MSGQAFLLQSCLCRHHLALKPHRLSERTTDTRLATQLTLSGTRHREHSCSFNGRVEVIIIISAVMAQQHRRCYLLISWRLWFFWSSSTLAAATWLFFESSWSFSSSSLFSQSSTATSSFSSSCRATEALTVNIC